MESDLLVEGDIVIPGSELWFTASRSSGPGGQNVNKVSTRVVLHWRCIDTAAVSEPLRNRLLTRLQKRISSDGVLMIQVEETRSQPQNREIARQRLAELVRKALAQPRRRIPTQPSAGAERRRLELKQQRARTKKLRQERPGDDE